MPATHTVLNQPPAHGAHDAYAEDPALREAVHREGAGWSEDGLTVVGRLVGDPAWVERGRLANEHRPVLHSHDRYGNRLDVVDYHPAYHRLMEVSVGNGLHAAPWADERAGAHVARAAKVITWYQVDGGHVCPISMTYSVVPALRHRPELAAEWEPRICSRTYDPANRPAHEKAGVTFGMAMTEKQGGSDVRANTTAAVRSGSDGDYLITGHKWFCSAPMSDAFLMLAVAPGGLSCFLVPRWRPDGTRNPIRIQRLKDKLGDRSNASSEIEMLDTWGTMVGEEGRGVRTIIEMVNHTRLDCVLGSTSIMRQGVAQATWHTHHRSAFGSVLDEQPLMANVLADLALESEAATVAAIRLARAFDAGAGDEQEQLIKRLVTPVVKYWTCKRAPQHTAEALECLGGVGFVEESGLPRLFRQSPLNGVWEGSGNVMCLDVLRALARSPEALEAYLAEVTPAGGADTRLARAVEQLRTQLITVDELLPEVPVGGRRRRPRRVQRDRRATRPHAFDDAGVRHGGPERARPLEQVRRDVALEPPASIQHRDVRDDRRWPGPGGHDLLELRQRQHRERGGHDRDEQHVARPHDALDRQRRPGGAVEHGEVVRVPQRSEQRVDPASRATGRVEVAVEEAQRQVGGQHVEPGDGGRTDVGGELPPGRDEAPGAVAAQAVPDLQQVGGRPLRVQVPDQHPRARAGGLVGEVHRGGGLAHPALDAGERHDLHRAIRSRRSCTARRVRLRS
jgi:putative acyl-CoA dehydrogenase